MNNEKLNYVLSQLNVQYDSTLLKLWNSYCSRTSNESKQIEIVASFANNGFTQYAYVDETGQRRCCSTLSICTVFDLKSMAGFIAEHNDDLGSSTVRAILDSFEQPDDDSESLDRTELVEHLDKLMDDNAPNLAAPTDPYDCGYAQGYHDALLDVFRHLGLRMDEEYFN